MKKVLEGFAASPGKAKGRVRVILSDLSAYEIKEGEVIVCPFTSPAYFTAMSKAAAVITDKGGLTAHAAIVSRELGIPCVTGTKKATEILKTGDLVLVDGDKGEVYLL